MFELRYVKFIIIIIIIIIICRQLQSLNLRCFERQQSTGWQLRPRQVCGPSADTHRWILGCFLSAYRRELWVICVHCAPLSLSWCGVTAWVG